MRTQNKLDQDTKVNRAELDSNKSKNNPRKEVPSNVEYYSEWAVENSSVEKPKSKKPGNSLEAASVPTYQTSNSEQYY